MRYLIGLDLGTSAVKGSLLGEDGKLEAAAGEPTAYNRGECGAVTFSGEDFYRRVTAVIRRLVSLLPCDGEIVGIGAASASGNTMLIGQDGIPLCEAFSWLDTRVTDEITAVLGETDSEETRDRCGWPGLASFPMAHLSWLRMHEPALLDSASKVCMSTDYVNFRLCGKWGIDPSTATTFYLADQRTASWNADILHKLGIPKEKLPAILPTGALLGHVTPRASKETGLPVGCAVVLGAFDHPTAARGAEITSEGQLLISCGTSWVCLVPLEDRSRIIGLRLLCDPFLSAEGGPWAGMFSLESVSTRVDAFVTRWIDGGNDRIRVFDTLARNAVPGAHGLRIDPMADADRDLSGYGKEDIARALMEGTAWLLAKEVQRMRDSGIPIASAVMVGGPSRSDPWPQIVTDMLGIEVGTVYGVSAGAVGAATLAAVAAGVYASLREAYSVRTPEKIVRHPDPETAAFYRQAFPR